MISPLLSRLAPALAAGPLAVAQTAPPVDPAQLLVAYTVTGTRERAPLRETPASVGLISTSAIRDTAPLHPGQLLGQIPGVAVAVTNGEGHTTAIRQPFTTSPLYLFLEDGIPVRATGFFNHNALYEVNLPGAAGIEVVRGPGSALHGSDAIGGVVNVLSQAPGERATAGLSLEAGSHGTRRVLAHGATGLGSLGAARLDVNVTHTDGWRQRTGYDRRSFNLRWDHALAGGTLKLIAAWSDIDQQTGANSSLPYADYRKNPTRNNFAIAYRLVEARRLSLEYQRQFGPGQLTLTPYLRENAMELNASFTLSADPRIESGENRSAGLLAKWRQDFAPGRTRLIAGLDLDRSPGSRREDNLLVTRTGSGASTVYTGYVRGTRIYAYDVTFRSAAPYVHAETSPLPPLRLTAGLRHDTLAFDLANRLPTGTVAANVYGATRHYGQIATHAARYTRASPKLGATWALSPALHLYGSLNEGFRAPSESQLFRAGGEAQPANALHRARLALALQPIRARQAELGLRGDLGRWSGHVVTYDLVKRDDLVSQRDLATNLTTSVNAGRTRHRGVEAGLGGPLPGRLRLDVAFSHARHTYEDWVTATANFSGKEMESAPRLLTNTRLSWTPGGRVFLQAEWVRLGAYWLEASNSPSFGRYPGHDLVNLRASWQATPRFSLLARVLNVGDRRHADSASVSSNTPVFTPGLPRSAYGGAEFRW